jgi:RNA polymerase sigma-70 factor (ECF subfamily)
VLGAICDWAAAVGGLAVLARDPLIGGLMNTESGIRFGSSADGAIFAALWHDARFRLLGVARRMTGSRADAEDVLQEAFCAAWRARAGYAGVAQPVTWLHRITVNAALMHLRRRRRRPTEALDESAEERLVDDALDPLAAIVRDEGLQALAAALQTLPALDRAVVLAEDGTDPCGGRTDDVTRSAWKSRRFRARRHLRTALIGAGVPP